MKKCVRCNATISWGREFCPVCGGELGAAQGDRLRPPAADTSASPVWPTELQQQTAQHIEQGHPDFGLPVAGGAAVLSADSLAATATNQTPQVPEPIAREEQAPAPSLPYGNLPHVPVSQLADSARQKAIPATPNEAHPEYVVPEREHSINGFAPNAPGYADAVVQRQESPLPSSMYLSPSADDDNSLKSAQTFPKPFTPPEPADLIAANDTAKQTPPVSPAAGIPQMPGVPVGVPLPPAAPAPIIPPAPTAAPELAVPQAPSLPPAPPAAPAPIIPPAPTAAPELAVPLAPSLPPVLPAAPAPIIPPAPTAAPELAVPLAPSLPPVPPAAPAPIIPPAPPAAPELAVPQAPTLPPAPPAAPESPMQPVSPDFAQSPFAQALFPQASMPQNTPGQPEPMLPFMSQPQSTILPPVPATKNLIASSKDGEIDMTLPPAPLRRESAVPSAAANGNSLETQLPFAAPEQPSNGLPVPAMGLKPLPAPESVPTKESLAGMKRADEKPPTPPLPPIPPALKEQSPSEPQPAPPVKKSAVVTSGEFLKMFPDADPGESVLGR